MGHIQSSLYSILEQLALQYSTYDELRNDSRFGVWMKHVRNKRMAQAFVKGIFSQRNQTQRELQAQQPMYF